MVNKSQKGGREEPKSAKELKEEIILKLTWGPKSGVSYPAWLKEAEALTKKNAAVIGEREAAQAWMQAISYLAEVENNDDFSLDDDIRLFIKMTGKNPNTDEKLRGAAAHSLEHLTQVKEYSLFKGILNQRDVDSALAAGKQVHEETNKLVDEPEDPDRPEMTHEEFSEKVDKIRERINSALRKSD